MAITTLDGYIGSAKQRIGWGKTTTRTTVGLIPFTGFDLAGNPGAGTLAGTSTTVPVLMTDTTTGFNSIDFSSGTTYLSKVEFSGSVAGRINLYDMITKSGAYTYAAATVTVPTSTHPDITGRCPDYTGGTTFGARNEIWIEVTTAFVTGTAWQVQVTYTNQAGTAGRTSIISAAQNAAALTLGKMFQIALAAGDVGVQRIESVIITNGGTAMTAGNFNVLIMRPIWTSGRVKVAGDGDIHDLLKTGLPIIYNTSALYIIFTADSTSFGYPNVYLELCNG
jgi:hypothetical protein